jgi:N-methylhydantoinase A/oxoprolinase/acetone carboxylase beta subunit
VVNTVLTASTKDIYARFASAVQETVQKHRINAPIMILKADGGTLPLAESVNCPVETIFSGPAASILGALSLTDATKTGVVVDVGGTTSDLALILSGRPLMSSKGVSIADNLTQVRSFAIKALPIGGDSSVIIQAGKLVILPKRQGPAVCMGGQIPTPTDALRVLGKEQLGVLSKHF